MSSSSSETSSETSSESSESSDFSDVQHFRSQLKGHGLVIRDVPGDGNCMFSAISDQLYGSTNRHFELRQQAVEYLSSHKNEICPFFTTEQSSLISDLARLGTFGDHTSLFALAEIYQANIVVHWIGKQPRIVAQPVRFHKHGQQFHLAFHTYGHYSSVRLRDHSSGPANVFISPKDLIKFRRRHRTFYFRPS